MGTVDTSFPRPFELHNRSLENTHICFLKWPPQHKNDNSNLVRFGMNTTA